LTFDAFNSNLPLVLLDDRLDDRQPETVAFDAGRVVGMHAIKLVENEGQVGGRDAVASVLDFNRDGVAIDFGGHRDLTVLGGVLDRVADKVAQGLPDAETIALNGRAALDWPKAEGLRFGERVRVVFIHHPGEQIVHAEQLQGKRDAHVNASQVEHTLHQFEHLLSGVLHAAHIIGLQGVQGPGFVEQLAVAHDGGDGAFEIVRGGGDEFVLDALDIFEVRHIMQYSHLTAVLAGRDHDREGPFVRPGDFASLRDAGGPGFAQSVDEVIVTATARQGRADFCFNIGEQLARRRVEEQHIAFCVQYEDGIGSGAQHGVETLMLLFYCFKKLDPLERRRDLRSEILKDNPVAFLKVLRPVAVDGEHSASIGAPEEWHRDGRLGGPQTSAPIGAPPSILPEKWAG